MSKVHSMLPSLIKSLVICLLLGFTVSADERDGQPHHHPPIAVQPAETYAPSALPDRIILTLNKDPRTTQTVNWRTSTEVAVAVAQIAPAEAGPNFPQHARQVTAETQALKTDLSTAHYHSVVFTDLKPGKIYAYRVGDGVNWSEWFQFRTANASDEAFSFVYFGDAQNDIRSMWSRVVREAYRDAPKAAFLLHAGDLVNKAASDAEWGEWFGAGGWLNAMTPSIAIPGNHEHAKSADGTRRVLCHHWRKVFTFPENGPRGLEETCFTTTYQNLRIIGLNSTELQEQQAAWLDQVLSENDLPWVVCTFHHPLFSTGKDRDNAELRALWKPIIDKYKVDLVLQGHDHTYGRTGFEVPSASQKRDTFVQNPNTDTHENVSATLSVGDTNTPVGVSRVDKDSGTIYVVSVSGPKMYNNTKFPFMKRVAEDTQLYQIIHIEGDKLRYEARTAIGQLYDAFELHKQDGKNNKLVELKPDVEQNLRK